MTDTLTLDGLVERVTDGANSRVPLACLGDAVELAGTLGELADHLVGHFVDEARRSGASWADIGSQLGVSRQAAQQRFVTPDHRSAHSSDPRHRSGHRSLHRFTKRARHVVELARQDAKDRPLSQVSNELLLLGLTHEPDGYAARAMLDRDVALERIRAAVESVIVAEPHPRRGRVGLDRDAKKTLELARRESLRLGNDYIGTEHLLLALLTGNTATTHLLAGLGIDHDSVVRWLAEQPAA